MVLSHLAPLLDLCLGHVLDCHLLAVLGRKTVSKTRNGELVFMADLSTNAGVDNTEATFAQDRPNLVN